MRGLLIAITVVCLLIGYKSQQLRSRRAAVAAIDAMGGATKITVEGPGWLRKLVGDEKAFYNVGSVLIRPDPPDYDSTRVDEQQLRDLIPHINQFSKFRQLTFRRTQVSDEGLSQLKQLSRLEWLDLCGIKVEDSALEVVSAIPSLRQLDVRNTKVTSKGVARFRNARPDCEVVWDGD